MDYSVLAIQLLEKMQSLHKMKPQKNISEALHGETFVLGYIAMNNGEVLPSEIGQKMDVSTARIATALNSLEKKGLITRRIDINDRRKILVGITEQGQKLAENHRKNIIEAVAKMLELLGEDDAPEYVRLTGKLATAMPNCEDLFNKTINIMKEKN